MSNEEYENYIEQYESYYDDEPLSQAEYEKQHKELLEIFGLINSAWAEGNHELHIQLNEQYNTRIIELERNLAV